MAKYEQIKRISWRMKSPVYYPHRIDSKAAFSPNLFGHAEDDPTKLHWIRVPWDEILLRQGSIERDVVDFYKRALLGNQPILPSTVTYHHIDQFPIVIHGTHRFCAQYELYLDGMEIDDYFDQSSVVCAVDSSFTVHVSDKQYSYDQLIVR